MIPRIDHWAHGVVSRDDLIEMVVYTSTGAERVIPKLREGDRIRVQREGKTYGQMELEVEDQFGDYAIVTDGRLTYELWRRWSHNLESNPWLRKDGDSKGRISSLTLLELA
jgi:hypothetical protein